MLPRVKIDFTNGALGQVIPNADNVIGILANAITVAGKFLLNTTYKISKWDDVVTTLGITLANNPGLYKLLKQLFDQTGDGIELYLKGFADTVTLTEMAELETNSGIKEMFGYAQGRINMVFLHRIPEAGYVASIEAGIDDDVYTAIAAAQVSCDWAETALKAPCMAVISGIFYSGISAELTAINTGSSNRIAVLIGDTVLGNGCAIGLLAGRLTSIPVQRNIGRTKDGAIKGTVTAYIGSDLVGQADVEGLHDKGFITFRTHIGRSGIFFSDDPLATAITDDYNHITARRTVDKAYREAYQILINELLDEIPVTAAGKITPAFAKSLENKVEAAIVNSMTASGNLGNDVEDPTDKGVVCFIDYNQNIISTGKVVITLKVKPYGYARYIDVMLGFQTLTV